VHLLCGNLVTLSQTVERNPSRTIATALRKGFFAATRDCGSEAPPNIQLDANATY